MLPGTQLLRGHAKVTSSRAMQKGSRLPFARPAPAMLCKGPPQDPGLACCDNAATLFAPGSHFTAVTKRSAELDWWRTSTARRAGMAAADRLASIWLIVRYAAATLPARITIWRHAMC